MKGFSTKSFHNSSTKEDLIQTTYNLKDEIAKVILKQNLEGLQLFLTHNYEDTQ